MKRERMTVYLDPTIARATRVRAARTGKTQSEVVEEALRKDSLLGVLEEIWAHSPNDLTDEEALALAVRAQHEMRARR